MEKLTLRAKFETLTQIFKPKLVIEIDIDIAAHKWYKLKLSSYPQGIHYEITSS